MNCNCEELMKEELKEKNLEVTGWMWMSDNTTRLSIPCRWVDRDKAPRGQKNNPNSYLATYCPFCGVKAGDY